MNIQHRRERLQQLVLEHGKVDIDDLVNALNVSTMTIRRDLMQLEKENKLIRTHGGAVPMKGLINETPFYNKESQFQKEKKAIAKKAAALVEDGSTIIIDSGTTTLELARVLKSRENLTVITNDILIAAEFMDSSIHVMITGGELQNQVGAMFGPHTQNLLEAINTDQLFLGAHALHPESGITAPTLEKAKIKQLMIASAKETWLLTDSSKFNRKSFTTVCSLDKIAGIITDENLENVNPELFHDHVIQATAKKED